MSDFHKSRGRRDGLQSYCRECSTRNQRRWLKRHRDVRHRYTRSVRQKHVLRKMEYLRGRSCVDCGETDPLVLEFDHRSGKSKNVADLVRSTVSWKRIEQEMAKCEIRCANCHRRKTARERRWLSSQM